MKDEGFTVITVAIERDAEDARPWIEKANPAHPSLIDTGHLLAELYNLTNVPTVLWIDEEGTIVRPNDVAFTTEAGGKYANVSTDAQMAALRAWVRGEAPAVAPRDVRQQQRLPSTDDQFARAHFGLGDWLYRQGDIDGAREQFARAGELSPHDFTIRRGTMPIVGDDPFGEEFREMIQEWAKSGGKFYNPLPVD